jgi:hypothetical protein
MAIRVGGFLPPFSKGGQGGLTNSLIIPLNPPLKKGDLKYPPFRIGLVLYHIIYGS